MKYFAPGLSNRIYISKCQSSFVPLPEIDRPDRVMALAGLMPYRLLGSQSLRPFQGLTH